MEEKDGVRKAKPFRSHWTKNDATRSSRLFSSASSTRGGGERAGKASEAFVTEFKTELTTRTGCESNGGEGGLEA